MAICVRILMNRLQQAVLALYDYDDAPDNISVENTLEQGLNILAKLPSIICYAYQSKMHRYNKESLVIHPAQEQPIIGLLGIQFLVIYAQIPH